MNTTKDQAMPLPVITFNGDCSKCVKADVCTILRAVGPLMANWDDNKPFEVSQLAIICKAYLTDSDNK